MLDNKYSEYYIKKSFHQTVKPRAVFCTCVHQNAQITTMEIKLHQLNDITIPEVISENIVIENSQDAVDLLGNLYYQGFDNIIINQKNITPDFFDLKTGIAGEILQKFSNYRVRLAIIGDFSGYSSKSIKDFIFESNKLGQINFVESESAALNRLSKNG